MGMLSKAANPFHSRPFPLRITGMAMRPFDEAFFFPVEARASFC